jgi:hypothetical protein
MKTPQQIQEELIERATSWGDALSRGDSRLANKQNSKIAKIARKLQEDKILYETVLIPLLAHSNPSIRLMASVYALDLEIHTDEAESVLTAIVEDPKSGLIRMMAHINLSNWNKKKSAKLKA